MKIFAFALCALAVPLVMGYDEKYDKLDVDKILGDEELFNAYIQCMLDKGPCSVEHSEDFRSKYRYAFGFFYLGTFATLIL